MKKLILSIAIMSMCALSGFAQSTDMIIIRVVETKTATLVDFNSIEASILIIYPDNTTETISLSKAGNRKFEENSVLIYNTIDKFILDGYKIISSNSSGGDMISNITFILTR